MQNKANLKKLLISYPPARWNKKVTSRLQVETFFFAISLSKKIYDKKIFKKGYFVYIYIQFLCWFIAIW